MIQKKTKKVKLMELFRILGFIAIGNTKAKTAIDGKDHIS